MNPYWFFEAVRKPFRVGVVGYSAGKFDEKKAEELVYSALDRLYKRYQGNIVIVSGLTNVGIPRIAYKYAKEKKLKTVGVACKKALDYDCFPCSKEVIVGDEWGDESATFLSSIDYMVRVGGGAQSHDEVKKFKRSAGDENVEEHELERQE